MKISQNISVSPEPRVRVSDEVYSSVALIVIGLSRAVPDAFEEQYGCCYANKKALFGHSFFCFRCAPRSTGPGEDPCRCLSSGLHYVDVRCEWRNGGGRLGSLRIEYA